jgi:hypothetical protein
MSKKTYRVGEGANFEALPRGTKVGDEIRLSPAAAMYEVDMGRIIDVEAEAAAASEPHAAETDGIEKTPVEGDTLAVPEDEAIASKSRRR